MSFLERSVSVRGRSVPTDLRRWDPDTRHAGSLVVVGAACALVLLGVLAYVLAPGATWVTWLLVVLLVILLVLEGGVVLTGLAAERQATATPVAAPVASTEEPAAAPAAGEPGDARVVTLQCSECGTVFDLHDDGTRPLVHACPGCGAEGVLEESDLPAPAPMAGPAEAPGWGEVPADSAAEPEEVPEVREEAPEVKRLKLRCGGCGTVFVVEDDGTRPLRHHCPGCGKTGELP